MAGLAVIVLEKAAEATLLLLARAAAAVATGAAVGELVKDRIERIDKAKDGEVARTAADTLSKTPKPCQMCPPDCGMLALRGWSMSDTSRAYQARITGFAPGTEWYFAGIDFDGFQSGQCLLQEAKANYDQFFDKNGIPQKWYRGFVKFPDQAKEQWQVMMTNPPAKLTWYFKTPITYKRFGLFLMRKYPGLTAEFVE